VSLLQVKLPVLHAGQVAIWRAAKPHRLNAVRCGRRYGKTKMMVTIAGDVAANGGAAGLYTPEHKQLQEPYDELIEILKPITRKANKTEGTIRTINGGVVDFWALNDNELAGRGREYDVNLVDEGAFTKNGQMVGIWKKSISPTMITKPKAKAWVFSTPNGDAPDNFFNIICNDLDKNLKFVEHYAPTSANPYIQAEELEREERDNHPLVWRQEFLAQFVDWSGVAFFARENLLVDGKPVAYPALCDGVFATVDTAIKTGSSHDGTGVIYWALNRFTPGPPAVILDWDIVQVDGDLLVAWLPNVFRRLEELALQCKARGGSIGTFVEDKASGITLIQHAVRNRWPVNPIDSKLTSVGKDERAISVSGYVYTGKAKISGFAFDKVTTYKGVTRNHLLSQVTGFRIGAKDGLQDDLLDAFCYGLAISQGNDKGY
jgi:hypothetical protein